VIPWLYLLGILAFGLVAGYLASVLPSIRAGRIQPASALRMGLLPPMPDSLKGVPLGIEYVSLLAMAQKVAAVTGMERYAQVVGQMSALYPEARRVLLTAYADTEAAIQAINTARIHYYLNKPWDPPEEKLYPVLSDLLEDWNAGYKPPFEGLRVIGHRWSLSDHRVRNFLSSNHVPYRWLDVAAGPEALKLLEDRQLNPQKLPVVLFAAGTVLVDPELDVLAGRVGLRVQAAQDFYDLVVVGAGPAGLAAAVYGASEGLSTVVIEPEAPGGQAGSSSRIENYVGFPNGISGEELASRTAMQAQRLGARLNAPCEVVDLRAEDGFQVVVLADGSEVPARTGAFFYLSLADCAQGGYGL